MFVSLSRKSVSYLMKFGMQVNRYYMKVCDMGFRTLRNFLFLWSSHFCYSQCELANDLC